VQSKRRIPINKVANTNIGLVIFSLKVSSDD